MKFWNWLYSLFFLFFLIQRNRIDNWIKKIKRMIVHPGPNQYARVVNRRSRNLNEPTKTQIMEYREHGGDKISLMNVQDKNRVCQHLVKLYPKVSDKIVFRQDSEGITFQLIMVDKDLQASPPRALDSRPLFMIGRFSGKSVDDIKCKRTPISFFYFHC